MPELPALEIAHPVRVRYAECDPMGVAHHASYAPWMEEARTELLRQSGKTYAKLEEEGVFLVITKMEIRYRRPIKYDDRLEIRCRHIPAGRIKIRHTYDIALIERNGQTLGPTPDTEKDPSLPRDGVCAIATTELACVGTDGRPQPLPDFLVVPENT